MRKIKELEENFPRPHYVTQDQMKNLFHSQNSSKLKQSRNYFRKKGIFFFHLILSMK